MLNQRATRDRVNSLFLLTATLSAVIGTIALLLPNVVEWALIHHGERLELRGNTDDATKLQHLWVRLLAAVLLGLAWVTHEARSTDSNMRRAIVRAWWGVSTAATLVLLRAQLTPGGGLTAATWVTTICLSGLAAAFFYFAFVEKVQSFQPLGSRIL